LKGKAERLHTGAKPNPFIDPQGYQRFVARMTKTFEDKLKTEKAGGK
jgi:metallo-beta-lactamase class B